MSSLSIPNHIAFIMDGNGRWAEARGKARVNGHKEGMQAMGRVVSALLDLPIAVASFYAFSLDNWKRDPKEVKFLHTLLKDFYRHELPKYEDKNCKVIISGVRDRLDLEVVEIIEAITQKTQNNDGLVINICFNYGARLEIVEAAKAFCKDVLDGRALIEDLHVDNFSSYMFAKNLPPVDLLVRSSGEQRISDFLLYHIAYAELYFTPVLWPDFTKETVIKSLDEFTQRRRRFGK